MAAVGMRVRWLLRHNWRATLLLAIAAGLASGIALTAWLSARRASVAFDEFFRMADPPELAITFCPPGMTDVDPESVFACFAYQPTSELEQLRALPEVALAAREAYQAADISLVGSGQGPVRGYISSVGDAGLDTPLGRPLVVQGRLADAAADDEVMVSEGAARTYGLRIGDRLDVHWLTEADFTTDSGPTGPQRQLEVVGIVRSLEDLNVGGPAGDTDTQVFVGPGVWAAVEGDTWFGFTAVAAQARNGDAIAAREAVQAAFPGRPFNNPYGFSLDDIQPVEEAFGYEAKAAAALAVLMGLAAAIFVGQAVARQARREWADLDVLRSIGFTARQAGTSAALRGLEIAAIAALVAVVTLLALSPWTPIGAAREAELHPGLAFDPIVTMVGIVAVVAVVTLVAWAPVHRLARRTRHARRGHGLVLAGTPLRPPAAAGVGMVVNSRRGGTGLPLGTAIAGVAFAIGVMVAALALTTSFRGLLDHSSRYGAPWDMSLRSGSPSALTALAAEVAGRPGVDAASALIGTELIVDGQSTWTIALEPVPGGYAAIEPVVIAGREPIRDDEIALGALTQHQIGKGIGDTVEVTTSLSTSSLRTLEIVGTAVMNSNDEGSPGFGGVTTAAYLRSAAPDEGVDALAIDLASGAAGDDARAALEGEFASSNLIEVIGPVKQDALRNVERLRNLPYLFGAVVALLAAGSLAHVLVLSVRRYRGQLAILKTLGFTRFQVSATVAWEATSVALASALVGVPAGIILGRWGWRAVADRLGLVSAPTVPALAVLLVVVAAVVVANLVAVAPGWRAGRIRPAEALRAE